MPTESVGGELLPAVAVREVSKAFTIPEEKRHTLKERALHPRHKIKSTTFKALNDVSFEIYPGEFFGIAGRNGSGKSTMLKCIAGIYQAQGDIWVRGRMSTFIELGVGFNPDMAAKDNIIMNGIMMGLTPKQARDRVDRVIDFAELQEFRDLKLKNYSSGMHVRLAFSVSIQVDADILLIDEVLAVGDAAFQQKCFDVFNEMRDAGKTIIFVTHDMYSLTRFCHRAMLLERGNTVYYGDPQEVADRYLELNFGRVADPEAVDAGERMGDGEARVIEVWVENELDERIEMVPQGTRMTINARVLFMIDVEDPGVSVSIHNDQHVALLVANSELQNERSGRFTAGDEAVFSFTFDNVLAPGRYNPVIQLSHRGSGLDVIDRFDGSFSFVVTAVIALGGLIDVPVDSGVQRLEAPAQEHSGV